jgi:hypothetical protein
VSEDSGLKGAYVGIVFTAIARELAAKLLSHRTSVWNVTIIAQLLRSVHNEAIESAAAVADDDRYDFGRNDNHAEIAQSIRALKVTR